MKKSVLVALSACVGCAAGAQIGQPVLVVAEADQPAELYATGEQVMVESESRYRYICGSDTAGLTNADLAVAMQSHFDVVKAAEDGEAPSIVIDTGAARGGFNVIFNVSGSPPSGAAAGIAEAEQLIESTFTDPSTVVISLSFQPLGPGVLGAAGSGFVNVNYADARNGLQNGMDPDDVIQDFLPTGTTIPVRYNASSTSVTNENRVFFTDANFKATIGSLGGTDANITISTNFNFDFNPANGISGGSFSFVDVLIHEVGHAMGFVSGVDFRNNDIEALDIFRFQRTDGTGDFNPDTLSEFQTTARTVDFNNLNDNANVDIIDAEYRMSDGSPSQASHFREQGGCGVFPSQIGIMDPSFSGGCTYLSRGYYTEADINMFDAIGYDRIEGVPTEIVQEPVNQTVCEGETAQFSVIATGENLSYQWFEGDGITFSIIPGATSPTLSLPNLTPADTFVFYFCEVTGSGGSVDSVPALLLVDPDPAITSQPSSQTVDEGDPVSFSVSATFANDFQWRRNGTPIPGATSSTFNIGSVTPADDGVYTVAVTNDCDTVISNGATLTVTPAPSDCLADVNGNGVAGIGD
ncbi:MAG: NF038122 family metalloprotease, partial [Planctomycetota bacterium]